MKKEKRLKAVNIIICSMAMSAVIVSAVFLSEIISIASNLLLLPYLLLVVVLYVAMLLSESNKSVLVKWVVSLPLSYLCFNYFWKTHYSVRALNWVINDYGKQSAGGNFAGFATLVFLLILCLAGIIFAFVKSSEKIKSYIKSQSLTGITMIILIMAIVLYLETLFPSYAVVIS